MGKMSSLTGGGGLSASSSAASRSGDASGLSGSGNKVFNFGANPNMGTAQVAGILTNPLVIGGVVIGLWLVFRRKK